MCHGEGILLNGLLYHSFPWRYDTFERATRFCFADNRLRCDNAANLMKLRNICWQMCLPNVSLTVLTTGDEVPVR
jgi:hypothetical protein